MLCTHLHEFCETRVIDLVYGSGGWEANVLLDIRPVHKRQVNSPCYVGCRQDHHIRVSV